MLGQVVLSQAGGPVMAKLDGRYSASTVVFFGEGNTSIQFSFHGEKKKRRCNFIVQVPLRWERILSAYSGSDWRMNSNGTEAAFVVKYWLLVALSCEARRDLRDLVLVLLNL